MASEEQDFCVHTHDGREYCFRGYVLRIGPNGTRYLKPRIAPKMPRKLKKALNKWNAEIILPVDPV